MAIKIFNLEELKKYGDEEVNRTKLEFEKESQILEKARHTNIIGFIEAFQT